MASSKAPVVVRRQVKRLQQLIQNKVVLQKIKAIKVEYSRRGPEQTSLRRFERHHLPALRFHNPHVQFTTPVPTSESDFIPKVTLSTENEGEQQEHIVETHMLDTTAIFQALLDADGQDIVLRDRSVAPKISKGVLRQLERAAEGKDEQSKAAEAEDQQAAEMDEEEQEAYSSDLEMDQSTSTQRRGKGSGRTNSSRIGILEDEGWQEQPEEDALQEAVASQHKRKRQKKKKRMPWQTPGASGAPASLVTPRTLTVGAQCSPPKSDKRTCFGPLSLPSATGLLFPSMLLNPAFTCQLFSSSHAHPVTTTPYAPTLNFESLTNWEADEDDDEEFAWENVSVGCTSSMPTSFSDFSATPPLTGPVSCSPMGQPSPASTAPPLRFGHKLRKLKEFKLK